MKTMTRILGVLLFILLNMCSVYADQNQTTATQSTAQNSQEIAQQLSYIKTAVKVLHENADSGLITQDQAKSGIDRYLKQASTLSNKPITESDLANITEVISLTSPQEISVLQRVAGVITFVNILWVLAIVLFVSGFMYLFGSVVIDLVKVFAEIPTVFYEALLYGAGASIIVYGLKTPVYWSNYIGLTGCAILTGAVIVSAYLHKREPKPVLFFGILSVLWIVGAVLYHSSMLGFVAVLMCMGVLGFSVFVGPLVIALGFEDDAALVRATITSFAMVALLSTTKIANTYNQYLEIFTYGGLFLGTFVGYLGLLIVSTKWYSRENYIFFQILSVLAGLAALGVGSVWQIGELQKIGGTFFFIYLFEKPLEIPLKHAKSIAFGVMLLGIALYSACMYIRAHPEVFSKYLYTF